jgi:hypothetical protein
MSNSWTPAGMGKALELPPECGCCDPCTFPRFCPSITSLCVSLSGFGNVSLGGGTANPNGDYLLEFRDPNVGGTGADCGGFWVNDSPTRATGLTLSDGTTLSMVLNFSTQFRLFPGGPRLYLFTVQFGFPGNWTILTLRANAGTINCSGFTATLNTFNSFSPASTSYTVTGTESVTASLPPCAGGGSAGPLSAPSESRSSTAQRVTLCTQLGQRLEHLAGCTGFRCRHECNSFDPAVISHLSNVMTATPSIDCQDCPGYSPATRHV